MVDFCTETKASAAIRTHRKAAWLGALIWGGDGLLCTKAGTVSGGGPCRGLLLVTAERISLVSCWQMP